MHVVNFALLTSVLIYGIFYEHKLLYIFLGILGLYTILSTFYNSKYNGVRRKIQIASWSEPAEGPIFALAELDATAIKDYVAKSKKTDTPVSVTAIVLKAVGEGLAVAPDLNGRICFGKYVPFETVDISCLVNVEDGKDLAFMTIPEVDKKTIEDVAEFMKGRADKLRKNQDQDHKKQTGMARSLPTFLLAMMLEFSTFITVTLGISIPAMSLKKFPFGGAMVTSVGMMGYRDVIAPFTPFAKVPLLLVVGSIEDKPVVRDGKIVIAPMLGITITIDHRYMDGGKAKLISDRMKDVAANPDKYSRAAKQK